MCGQADLIIYGDIANRVLVRNGLRGAVDEILENYQEVDEVVLVLNSKAALIAKHRLPFCAIL